MQTPPTSKLKLTDPHIMRWLAIAVSPLVRRTRDTILPRCNSRAVLGKRMWASMTCLATESGGSTVDVDRVRRDMLWDAEPTPVAHFNSAGDSPMPLQVLERVQAHMQMEATLGGYEAAANVQEELEAVYSSAAQLINAKPNEIALQVSSWRADAKCSSVSPVPVGLCDARLVIDVDRPGEKVGAYFLPVFVFS